MKILMVLTFLFCSRGYASVSYIEKSIFHCSDSKKYDVARSYLGGWGPGEWAVVAICKEGTLTQNRYGFAPLGKRHSDVEACFTDESGNVENCYFEYERLNGLKGSGELPEIVHGSKQEIEISCRKISDTNVRCGENTYKLERTYLTCDEEVADLQRQYRNKVRECNAHKESGRGSRVVPR